MLHKIFESHTSSAIRDQPVPKNRYENVMKSYRRLADLVTARDGAGAEIHWRRHIEKSGYALRKGYEMTKVRDI